MQKLRLLPLDRYIRSDEDDPLPLYYLPFFGSLYRGRVELALNGLRPGLRVLEIGYGSGTSFLNLALLYQEIHGVDLHRRGQSVEQVFAREGIDVQLCTGNLLSLPYKDEFFDAVLCISILEHLKPAEQPPAMCEIERVLRPGGLFVYGVPAERPLMQFGFRLVGFDIRQHHFSTEQDVAQAAATRFRQVALEAYQPFGAMVGSLYEVGVFERA
jgi:ubiquinone/menaquinone biosynthesis C-methylase UbiE